MESETSSNQALIVTHAVLAGLTPLIPLPLVDDLVLNYFRRRMVRKLGAAHGLSLPPTITATLIEGDNGGRVWGCLTAVAIYPVKSLFRKIFFVLEWKRVVDLTSRTFHDGYLVDYAFAQGWLAPDAPFRSEQVRAAIVGVVRDAPIKPVEAAVRVAFRQSRSTLSGGARMLERRFRSLRGRPDDQAIAQIVETVEPQEERELAAITDRVQQEIDLVSANHFDSLKAELNRRLLIRQA